MYMTKSNLISVIARNQRQHEPNERCQCAHHRRCIRCQAATATSNDTIVVVVGVNIVVAAAAVVNIVVAVVDIAHVVVIAVVRCSWRHC